jgi:hypothetical protein
VHTRADSVISWPSLVTNLETQLVHSLTHFTCFVSQIPSIFHKTLIRKMESLFLTFPVMFHFLPLIITLKYTINNEKINHEFVLSQRKEITHVIGNVRVPITLRDNRKENFYNVPAIVKLLTKGQDMTVNQEITLYVYTHSFSILC